MEDTTLDFAPSPLGKQQTQTYDNSETSAEPHSVDLTHITPAEGTNDVTQFSFQPSNLGGSPPQSTEKKGKDGGRSRRADTATEWVPSCGEDGLVQEAYDAFVHGDNSLYQILVNNILTLPEETLSTISTAAIIGLKVNLVVSLAESGSYDGARAVAEEVQDSINTAVEGPARERLAALLYRALARVEQAEGSYKDALVYAKKLWAKQAELHGPESFEAVTAYVFIASLHLQAGDVQAAAPLIEQAEEMLGESSEDSCPLLYAYTARLGATLELKRRDLRHGFRRVDRALLLLQRAIERSKGEDGCADLKLEYATCHQLKGEILRENAQWNEAILALRRALTLLSRVLHPTHPTSIRCLVELARTYSASGRGQQATAVLDPMCDDLHQQEIRGAVRSNVLAVIHEAFGDVYGEMKSYREAIVHYNTALTRYKQLHFEQPEHPNLMIVENKLGLAYSAAGRFEEAFSAFQTVVSYASAAERPVVPVVSVQTNMASLYRMSGNLAKAKEIYSEMLEHSEVDDAAMAKIMGCLAGLHTQTGDFYGALTLNRDALILRERSVGELHLDTAASHGNIAELCFRQGQLDEAIYHADKCYSIAAKLSGRNHEFCKQSSQVKAVAIRQKRQKEYRKISGLSKGTVMFRERK